jgi:hypothetical protein
MKFENKFIDFWGFTRGPAFIWLVALISTLFVVLEVKYNIDLLNSISNPNSNSTDVADLSDRGKLLASIGITWAIARALLTKIKPAAFGLVLFGIASFCTYHFLDYVYTKVIKDLNPEVKVQGFNLFAYRQDILTGKLSDPDLPTPLDQPVIGKILMGAFPIIILDERYMLPAQDILIRKAEDKRRFALKKAEKEWKSYKKNTDELSNSYSQFITQSRKAIKYRYWGGVQKFKRESGGMSPNPRATKLQFIEALKNSNHPKGKNILKHESRVIAQNTDGTPVYGRELPYFLDHDGYISWFEERIKQSENLIFPNIHNVENFKGIHEINSAIFLPPMAIVTSLVSAVTNGISVILILSSVALSCTSRFKPIGSLINKYSVYITFFIFFSLIYAVPNHVFSKNSALYELEVTMHAEVGIIGRLWSRLSNLQKLIL